MQRQRGYLDRVNGYHDHVHCLISLAPEHTISNVAQLIKGESSFWFNKKSGFKNHKLEWQDEYFAVSVSESMVNKVRVYIDAQEKHHKKKSFEQEYDDFMVKYGFEIKSIR